MTDEGPSLDAFLRHLQTDVDGDARFGILSGDDLVARLSLELPDIESLIFAMGGVDGLLKVPPHIATDEDLIEQWSPEINYEGLHQIGHFVVDVRFWNISACIVRHMSPNLSLKRRYIDSSLVNLAILPTNRPILSSKSFKSRPRQSTPEQWFIDLEIEQWKHHQQSDNPMMQPYGVGSYVKLKLLSQPTYDCKTKDDAQ